MHEIHSLGSQEKKKKTEKIVPNYQRSQHDLEREQIVRCTRSRWRKKELSVGEIQRADWTAYESCQSRASSHPVLSYLKFHFSSFVTLVVQTHLILCVGSWMNLIRLYNSHFTMLRKGVNRIRRYADEYLNSIFRFGLGPISIFFSIQIRIHSHLDYSRLEFGAFFIAI